MVDVEGMVSHEGDVLIRLTGVAREAARLRSAEASSTDAPLLWPVPRLVPVGVLNDRQTLGLNWDALSHVLIAAPLGQGVGTAMTAILASLAARSTPTELQLRVVAAKGSLPREVLALPHQATPTTDAEQIDDVQMSITSVVEELARRQQHSLTAEPPLVFVVRELCELSLDAIAALTSVLIDGPRYGIRLLVGTEHAATDLQNAFPALTDMGTRLVLRTSDEDESVALVGSTGRGIPRDRRAHAGARRGSRPGRGAWLPCAARPPGTSGRVDDRIIVGDGETERAYERIDGRRREPVRARGDRRSRGATAAGARSM